MMSNNCLYICPLFLLHWRCRYCRSADRKYTFLCNLHEYLISIHTGNCSEWNGFLYGIGPRWKKTIEKWFLDPRSLARPVLVVRYEDLKRDPVKEVKRMLEFLKFTYDEQSLAERLAKKASESFHRNHTDSNFEHYTTEQKKYINSLLQDTIQLLKQRGVEQRFNLHEYLR